MCAALVTVVAGVVWVASFEQGFDLARGTFNPRRMEQANELLALFMLRRVKAQVRIPFFLFCGDG